MRNFRIAVAGLAFCVVPATKLRAQSDDARYVSPTNRTVTASLEQGMGSSPSQLIWVQNISTVPIHVYGVTLRNCENIRGECGSHQVNVPVPPGGRRLIRRVESENPDRGMSFNYGFSWRADSSNFEAIRLIARNGVADAQQVVSRHDNAALDDDASGAHETRLSGAELAALGTRVASLRVAPDSVVTHVGQAFVMHQVRLLALDSAGEVLGRVSGYRWRVPPGPLRVQAPDTVTAVRTGRVVAEFQVAAPTRPLGASLPIVVVADSTPLH